jgi:hypothetical protein
VPTLPPANFLARSPCQLTPLVPPCARSLFSHSPGTSATEAEVSSFLVYWKLLLNKGELENLYGHFGADGGVDLKAFLEELGQVIGGVDPVWVPGETENPNTAHLALSGKSSMNFGEQYKAFPSHWGTPPNTQMKGHHGVVRDLPGGYGKGNAPMEKWVRDNMIKDKNTFCDERGNKPFPFGARPVTAARAVPAARMPPPCYFCIQA